MRGRIFVIAVGVGVAVVATTTATQTGLAKVQELSGVSIVLGHSTIHAGTNEPIVIVNDSSYSVGYNGCTVVSRRTSAQFKLPRNWVSCLAYTPIAAHSRLRLLMTESEDPIAGEPPGNYWVWIGYWRQGQSKPEYVAHAKLAVVS